MNARPLAVVVVGLLASPMALAHRPHNIVIGLATDTDFATTGEAWLVQDPHDISSLMRSTDFGAHWDFVPAPACEDQLADVALADGVLLLLAGDGTIWSSADGATTWASLDIAAQGNDLDAVGDQIALATDDGAFVGDRADIPHLRHGMPGVGLHAISLSPADASDVVALAHGGGVWESTDGGLAWTERMTGLESGQTGESLATVDGTIYVGTSDGALRLDPGSGAWVACGTLPDDTGRTYTADVPALRALASGQILAATGEQVLFVSDNACASWSLLDAGIKVEYGGIGNASSPEESFTGLYFDGQTALAAGYMGVSWSDDAGSTWTKAKLLAEDYSRGVAVAFGSSAMPLLMRGGYGGGVGWTADGGRSWCGSSVGMAGGYAYDVALDPDYANTGIGYFVGNNAPYRSEDFGATWAPLSIPMDRAGRFKARGDRVWMLGADDADGLVHGRLAVSDDGGASWDSLDSYADASDGASPHDLSETTLDGQPALLVPTDLPAGLMASTDDGESWRWLYLGDQDTVAGGGSWPPGSGTRLVFASEDTGVLLSDDGGRTWRAPTAPPDGSPRDMVQGDDGTWLLINREGQFYKSEDGGETWLAVGEAIGRAEFSLALSADFAETQTALVGTNDGLFWTRDAGDSWHRLPRYERFEAGTYHLSCVPADGEAHCNTWDFESAGLGGGWDLDAGDTVSFTFHGQSFRTLGMGDGILSVAVNGESAGSTHVGQLVSVPGEDWKDVVLTLSDPGKDGLKLDLIEGFTEGEALPEDGDTGSAEDETVLPEPDPDCGGYTWYGGGCGCAQGVARPGSAEWVGVMLLVLMARHRRRATIRARPVLPSASP